MHSMSGTEPTDGSIDSLLIQPLLYRLQSLSHSGLCFSSVSFERVQKRRAAVRDASQMTPECDLSYFARPGGVAAFAVEVVHVGFGSARQQNVDIQIIFWSFITGPELR